jgi:hypothetical protein
MARLVIDIPDNKVSFFMELIKNLGIKRVQKLSDKQKSFVDDLQHSLEQVKQHQDGKIRLQSAEDFLNEL